MKPSGGLLIMTKSSIHYRLGTLIHTNSLQKLGNVDLYTFTFKPVTTFLITMTYDNLVFINGWRGPCQGWRESPLTCYLR